MSKRMLCRLLVFVFKRAAKRRGYFMAFWAGLFVGVAVGWFGRCALP